MTQTPLQDLKTGTTTVGLVAKDCVVLGADMRASMGHIAYDEESQKLYRITKSMGLTNAGSVGDSLTVIRYLKSHANTYELERGKSMSVKAAANFLSNILNSYRYYPFMVQFLLGGFDDGKPVLWEVTPTGAILERPKYGVSGSGTEEALTAFDLNYTDNMSESEAVELAVQAVKSGMKRDVFSGGRGVSIMIVDKNGIREQSRRYEEVLKQKSK